MQLKNSSVVPKLNFVETEKNGSGLNFFFFLSKALKYVLPFKQGLNKILCINIMKPHVVS